MQITYFPYLPLKEDQIVDFGNGVVIWHFNSLSEKYIPDQAIRDLVKKLLDANVQGEKQELIKGVSVLSIGNTDFRSFSPKEEQLVQEAKLILFISRISKTNTTILGSGADGWTLSTSENFEPVFQNFIVGNDHIGERTGIIINVGIAGYRINEKKFHKPSHVAISPFGLSMDEELFQQLSNLQKKNRKHLYRRILRATELLFQAYYNTSNLSINARVLLMASAFETLLDLPENQGRKYFKDLVEKYCDTPNEPKYRHFYYVHNKAKRDKNRSIKVLWADSFFQLRNQIIHGDFVKEETYSFKGSDRHIDIAILFFVQLIKQKINEGYFSHHKPFLDFIEWKTRNDGTTGFNYEDKSVAIALAKLFREARKKRNRK